MVETKIMTEMKGHGEQSTGIWSYGMDNSSLGPQFWRAKVFSFKQVLDGFPEMNVDKNIISMKSQRKGF